jgi:hypothetical protein
MVEVLIDGKLGTNEVLRLSRLFYDFSNIREFSKKIDVEMNDKTVAKPRSLHLKFGRSSLLYTRIGVNCRRIYDVVKIRGILETHICNDLVSHPKD